MAGIKGDPYNILNRQLPVLDKDEITAEIFIPDDVNGIFMRADLNENLIEEARIKPAQNISITRLITYLDLIDSSGQPITSYQIRLRYTYRAWKKAEKDPKGERPRIAYLVRKETGWAEQWIELINEIIDFEKPKTPFSYGFIDISIDNLPDPLIGGC